MDTIIKQSIDMLFDSRVCKAGYIDMIFFIGLF